MQPLQRQNVLSFALYDTVTSSIHAIRQSFGDAIPGREQDTA
ncbi:hypothetical protein SynNOUM97013_01542 [Synechococcus sp. NOUM97013]|nr:hypothetical protein SynNOUM97013_01542 [Synechococcus sp. NOUM97013]